MLSKNSCIVISQTVVNSSWEGDFKTMLKNTQFFMLGCFSHFHLSHHLYSVLSYCFHHFSLDNYKYLCVQTMFINLYEKCSDYLFWNALPTTSGFNAQLKIEGYGKFALHRLWNSLMITLKNSARYSEWVQNSDNM